MSNQYPPSDFLQPPMPRSNVPWHWRFWHSTNRNLDRFVYHWRRDCTESNNIETHNLAEGIDGRSPCHHCRRLDLRDRTQDPLAPLTPPMPRFLG